MALTINTNIASVSAQRHLNESRKDLDIAMERLSSGQRINSAKDDAAGLAIRDKMSSQIQGLNQSVRNANDAISLAQTAEGAMEESTAILHRMRVLAMQSINDTNTDSDRSNLNDEYEQLTTELSRIAITSSFNNKKLLDGTFTGSTFQVGPGASETIFLAINDQKANAIGTTYDVASFDIFAADTPAKGDSLSLTIRGADGDGGNLTVTYTADKAETATQTAAGMVLALNSNSTFSQKYQALTDANNSILIRRTDGTSMGLPIRAQFDVNAAAANDTVTITVDGVDTGGAAKTFTYTSDAAETAFEVATGVTATLNADTNGFGRFYKAYASSEGKVEIRAKDGTNVDTSQITVSQAVSNNITYSTHSSTPPSEAVVTPPSTQTTTYNTHASTPPSTVVITPAAEGTAEFQVNTYTTNAQSSPSVTALNDGGFVTTWQSDGQDGADFGIYGQRYDSAGAKAGAEFQVNTYTTNAQSSPSVTALNDGGFVATWSSYGLDGSYTGVSGQRYDSAGAKAGAEFQVNTYTTTQQDSPSVTALNDGGFVATWQSNWQDGDYWGIYGQRYDSAGAKAGAEFQVNTYTHSSQGSPSVTALNDGGFVATWQSLGQDGSIYGIYGQRYDSAGAKAGAEFQVNTYTTSFQDSPSVTALNDGGFVATWQSWGQDGSSWGIYGQRYDSTGAKAGAEFQVNTYIYSYQSSPSITALNDGGFVVTWESGVHQDYGVFGQRYNSSGATVGAEFQINTFTNNNQSSPSVTALNDGGFVTTWQSDGQDGADFGIYGQRYDSAGQAVTTGSTTGVSTLDFSSLGLNAGDRITLNITGGSNVTGVIGSAGLDALLTTLASDVAAQTGLFSGASASSGVLTLSGLTDGSAMAAVTVSLEEDTITPAVTGSNSLNFSSLSLNAGDRITLTIAGGTQVQGTIGSAGLDALLTSMASDVASQTGLFSGASSSSGILILNGLTNGSAMAAVTVSLEEGISSAVTINQIINEHTGFEISVTPALNSQGALSVSSVVKAVDVFVDDTDILSASAAMQAVRVVDDAVAMIGSERSNLGAFQNRLEHAVSNMSNTSQNTQSARSVIADADYAKEATDLAKNQILQQAGTAMLAQANSQAETVLSLLK